MIDEANGKPDKDNGSLHRRLVRYFHECLAVQSDWGRAINVIDQTDVTLLPLTATEQRKLGDQGELRLSDSSAIDLAKRFLTGGNDVSLNLGALFLVGRKPAQSGRAERKYCGPILEVSLGLEHDADGQIVIAPDDTEFSINYSMLAELLDSEDDELQDQLEELAELVPDFPIDAGEFDAFWRGFRLITPQLPFDPTLPDQRKTQPSDRLQVIHDENLPDAMDSGRQEGSVAQSGATAEPSLQLIDFYAPSIPKQGFRLLPSTAVVLHPKAGSSMSALAELRQMEGEPLDETAFGCLFDIHRTKRSQYRKSDRGYPDEVLPLPLTPAQAAVLESARTSPLTVVTGPPGTGKSHTITAIVLDALQHHQTVLVSSHMDKAVEVVADRVESLLGPIAIARSGGRAAQRQLAGKISDLTGPRKRRDEITSEIIERSGRHHYELTRQLQSLEDRYQEAVASERKWSRLCQEYDSIRAPQWVSRNAHRDVSLGQIDRLLERCRWADQPSVSLFRRWVGKWSMRRLGILLGVPSQCNPSLSDFETARELYRLDREIRQIEHRIQQHENAVEVFDQISRTENQRQRAGLELVRLTRTKTLQTISGDTTSRSQLRDLATLLRRRKHELKHQLQDRISSEMLLQAFPAWACTSRSLCEVLPAEAGMFDLVVIDEASQCDLALAAVALMRAKRVVVVGDPQQLRRVCFLSRAREQAAMAHCEIPQELQHRFSYRRSLFDVASDMVDRKNFFFLDEHFRSHPQIIEFSNRKFYRCDLSIMTRRPSTLAQRVIHVDRVDGRRLPDSSVNPAEIESIIQSIREIVSETPQANHPSIGVVSPFRDQVDAIQERLVQVCSTDQISRHRIVVGTAHALQGDEKDLIFLSTSIDRDSHPASLRFLESPNLFNVAITRARREMRIVTSVGADDLSPGLLREYLIYANERAIPESNPQSTDGDLETRIVQQLHARNLPSWPGFQSAGQRINVATEIRGQSIAILIDRWDHQLVPEWKTLEQHRRLARAGWQTVRRSHRQIQEEAVDWLTDLTETISR